MKLSDQGLKQPLYLMQSGGGIASVTRGQAAIHLIESVRRPVRQLAHSMVG